MLSLTDVRETLPPNFRQNISQDMVDQINALSSDSEEARHIRDNFISFSQVMHEGKFKLNDYVKAVMFVSHKIMGKTNLDAYRATFPIRHQKMVDAGKPKKDINSIVTAYNKGLLVTRISESASVPVWLLNQDKFQKALNTQYDLMTDTSVSDKVRCEAANSLLTHLKKPEIANKSEVKIDIQVNDGMAALQDQLRQVAANQRQLIEDGGATANDIATMPMKKQLDDVEDAIEV